VIEWIDILTMLAIGMAVMGIVLAFVILVAYVRRMIPQKPSINLEPIKKKEKQKMSDQQRESVTFNDIFMFMIAVPLVLLWVGFAGYVIWHGLRDPTVLTQIEGYTTLIAILGGPALLIIKDALDVWKQEQAEKTAFYKIKAQAVIDYNDSMQKQAQMIEAKQQEQEHKMENKK
jgi:H+/gluconate symporter-like permease